jgi:hypothetical protein
VHVSHHADEMRDMHMMKRWYSSMGSMKSISRAIISQTKTLAVARSTHATLRTRGQEHDWADLRVRLSNLPTSILQ